MTFLWPFLVLLMKIVERFLSSSAVAYRGLFAVCPALFVIGAPKDPIRMTRIGAARGQTATSPHYTQVDTGDKNTGNTDSVPNLT